MPIKFLYFDLGKVLLDFDIALMCRQMGTAAGVAAEFVHERVFLSPLQREYEMGRVSPREFYDEFCRLTGSCPEYDELAVAGNEIFTVNVSMLRVVSNLQQAGYPMGILSNTSAGHWDYCLERFRILREFPVHALSFRIGAMKPDPAIYLAAAGLAGVAPQEVFFTDDMAVNAAGARDAGFDAIQYTGTPELIAALGERGIRFNH